MRRVSMWIMMTVAFGLGLITSLIVLSLPKTQAVLVAAIAACLNFWILYFLSIVITKKGQSHNVR